MKRPKLLISLFRFPYPATDGTRYKILNNVIEGLAKDFDLEFFIVTINTYTQEQVTYLEKYGKVYIFYHTRFSFLMNALPALWSGLPLQAQSFFFRDAKKWINAHVENYDAVYVHEIRLTEYFIDLPEEQKKKVVVDFNDAISLHYRESLKKVSIFKKLFYLFEGSRVSRYESRVLKSFFYFNIVSEHDRAYLLEKASLKKQPAVFTVIHHGVVIDARTVPLDHPHLFFMGNLDYEPNRDALVYFLETIWPAVHRALPTLEFFVAGKGKKIEISADATGIHFVGFVADIFAVMKKCSLLVVPLRFGGGTPSKTIESMSYGLPTLTTPQGSAGIAGAENMKNIYIVPETNLEEWVRIIKKNSEEISLRRLVGAGARQLIIDQYSSILSQEKYRELFIGVISAR